MWKTGNTVLWENQFYQFVFAVAAQMDHVGRQYTFKDHQAVQLKEETVQMQTQLTELPWNTWVLL